MRLDRQLCFALYSTSLAMTKRYQPVLASLGLTYPQYLVMLALWDTSPLSVSALGQRLYLDSGTLTPLLKRMEAAGWLVRERDPDDERRVLVRLAEQGRQLHHDASGIPMAMAAATRCSLDELAALTQQLQTLRERIGSIADA